MEAPTPYRNLLPPEEALLLICARREIAGPLLEAATGLAQRVDWERWLRLTLEHRVGPVAYASMKRYSSSTVPDTILARLRQDALANTQGNLAVLRELRAITRQLTEAGIRFAVFKGLVINQMVYQDLGTRKCGDIDLLTSEEDFGRAKALFISQGFTPTLPASAEIEYLQCGLWHEQRRIHVDLHWGIPPREAGVRARKILNTSSEISIGGVTLPAPSAEDLLLVLCVNATKEYWGQHLYPYCDIHEFLQRHGDLDWESLIRRARTVKCERMLQAALGIVKELYETSLPAQVEARLRPGSPADRVARELQQQLFDLNIHHSTKISQTRHLYCFDSQGDYFLHLIDSRFRRFMYRHLYWRIWRIAPEAGGAERTPLPRPLFFLRPMIRMARIAGPVCRKLYRKLGGAKERA